MAINKRDTGEALPTGDAAVKWASGAVKITSMAWSPYSFSLSLSLSLTHCICVCYVVASVCLPSCSCFAAYPFLNSLVFLSYRFSFL